MYSVSLMTSAEIKYIAVELPTLSSALWNRSGKSCGHSKAIKRAMPREKNVSFHLLIKSWLNMLIHLKTLNLQYNACFVESPDKGLNEAKNVSQMFTIISAH